jgi:hypothetical protein
MRFTPILRQASRADTLAFIGVGKSPIPPRCQAVSTIVTITVNDYIYIYVSFAAPDDNDNDPGMDVLVP